MGDPRAVEAVAGLALLVLVHLGQRVRGHLGLAPVGDERAHAAHRVRAAAVARLDQQLRVGAHERHGHSHLRAIRQCPARSRGERLDDAEDVVPAAGVEAGGVLAQLVQDLVHLECGPDRLDQNRGADRAARHADHVLRPQEHVVPQPRLAVALHLGQVEVGPRSAAQRLGAVVEQVQPEVEQRARHRLAVDLEMALHEMPAARPNDERRDVSLRRYCLPSGEVNSSVRRGRRPCIAAWPSTTFAHVGDRESSKSAMKTLAPELSALIVIFGSAGPVISTRRSFRSSGAGGDRPVRLAHAAPSRPGSRAARRRRRAPRDRVARPRISWRRGSNSR